MKQVNAIRLSSRHGGSARGRRQGSSLVEFALVVPILIVMVMGIIEFGWFVRTNLVLANGVREGARAMSLGKSKAWAQARVLEEAAPPLQTASGSFTNGSSLTVQYGPAPASTSTPVSYTDYPNAGAGVQDSGDSNTIPSGNYIKVFATARYQSLTKFFPFMNSRPLAVSVIMQRD